MEKAPAKKTAKVDQKTKIITGYVEYVLEHGKQPASVFKFAKELKMKEEEFYTYFTSFESIKSAVWAKLFDDTIGNLESQEVYKDTMRHFGFRFGLCSSFGSKTVHLHSKKQMRLLRNRST